jgi:hypothetical protein
MSATVSTIMMASCHTWIYEFGSSFHANLKVAANKESGSVDCMSLGYLPQGSSMTGRFWDRHWTWYWGRRTLFIFGPRPWWQSNIVPRGLCEYCSFDGVRLRLIGSEQRVEVHGHHWQADAVLAVLPRMGYERKPAEVVDVPSKLAPWPRVIVMAY